VWGLRSGGFVGGCGLAGFSQEIWESCHRLVDASAWEKLNTSNGLATLGELQGVAILSVLLQISLLQGSLDAHRVNQA
jgi:hypothetical protein